MAESSHKKLALIAMIFAVSMTFIDQTIVSISIPVVQKDLGLSSTGVQWIINGYLLALAALFAFGGRVADIYGHRRMVMIGIAIFGVSSALCGATPTGSIAEAWIIFFRIVQGAGAAIMFPAALAIVVAAYPQNERGKALAIFFGVAGGMTALGPIAGGYLIDYTWRAIFWINVPIAIVAVLLTLRAKPDNTRRPAPLDYRGAVLFAGGMGLVVLGLQESSIWGWDDIKTWASIAIGVVLMGAFVKTQLSTEHPLMQLRIFKNKAFAADNVILFLISIAFVPMFLFASLYSQISLGDDASNAGLYIGTFFLGFVIAAQRGGAVLDKQGAKAIVAPGCVIAAVGFYLWGQQMPDLDYSSGWWRIAMAGAGTGLILGPVSTDALNRAPGTRYGEVTGITQTARNLGASLGLAILGTILVSENTKNAEAVLTTGKDAVSKTTADKIADSLSQAGSGGGGGGGGSQSLDSPIGHKIQEAFAMSSQTVFYVMAGAMAAAYFVCLFAMPKGKAPEAEVVGDHDEFEASPPPAQAAPAPATTAPAGA